MWTSDDSYCEGVWNDYQRALKIIEQFKDSPIEDIAFLCKYCEMIINENFKEQEENDKRFKVINLLQCERDDYIHYANELEKTAIRYADNNECHLGYLNYLKDKYINYDYDKKYNENKLSWIDLTRR